MKSNNATSAIWIAVGSDEPPAHRTPQKVAHRSPTPLSLRQPNVRQNHVVDWLKLYPEINSTYKQTTQTGSLKYYYHLNITILPKHDKIIQGGQKITFLAATSAACWNAL